METKQQQSYTLLICTSPWDHTSGKTGIDAALALGAFGQKVQWVFIQNGVYHLLSKQAPLCPVYKKSSHFLSQWSLYDINQPIACQSSLQERSLSSKELITSVNLVNRQVLQNILDTAHHLWSF